VPHPTRPTPALTSPVTATLESNLHQTLDAIAAQAKCSGRDPSTVQLLAVTKSVEPALALRLARLGQRDLGENRLPKLREKLDYFATEDPAGELDVTWHYIGQIQRNKARKVLQQCDVLHSVDTLALIEVLERIAAEETRTVSIYLEVKLSTDTEKHGFPMEDLPSAIRAAGRAPHLHLQGLMAMATHPDHATLSPEQEFQSMAHLAQQCERDEELGSCFEQGTVRLSMGMSGDFPAAIAAGSHVVRIGSALFQDLAPDHDERTQGAQR
jgi:pyridoxal phosphate enzyme (YggS family)